MATRNYNRSNQERLHLLIDQLFDNYITYVAKLEYGVDRRWHYHVVFFYDGQKVKNDYLLAQALGEYWVGTITRGFEVFGKRGSRRAC